MKLGEWASVGEHPTLPGKTFHGHTTLSWLDSSAFLLVHMHIDEREIPDGVAILGTDDATPDAGAVLYVDVRKRLTRISLGDPRQRVDVVAQRARLFPAMVLSIAEDGQSIEAKARCHRT